MSNAQVDLNILSNNTGTTNAQQYANQGGEAPTGGAILQLGAAAAPSLTVATNGASGEYVAPFIAALYVDASGTVGTLQQQTVTITGIDSIFDLTASATQARNLLAGFKVTDENIDASAGNWGAAGAVQANVSVSMRADASGGFKDALAAVIAMRDLSGNHNNGLAGYETLYKYLKQEARKDTVDLLNYDTLANLLEGSDLLTFDIQIDASNGALNMYNVMDSPARADARRALFTQLPLGNVHAYVMPSNGVDGSGTRIEETKVLNFLPLLRGDKLSFVFDVTVGEYSFDNVAITSGADMTTALQDASGALAGVAQTNPAGNVSGAAFPGTTTSYLSPATVAGKPTKLVFSVPTRRRIALRVQMSSGGGAFANTYAAGSKTLSLA